MEDLAGNSTNRRKLGFVQIKDGIAPRLTVKLSGGSGLRHRCNEGPDRLTKRHRSMSGSHPTSLYKGRRE